MFRCRPCFLAATVVLLASACTPQAVSAAPPADAAAAEKAIRTRIQDSYGSQGIGIISIASSPVAGIYEVYLSGNQLVYMSADGRHMFTGDLIDTEQRKNLSETRRSELNRVDYTALPLEQSITEVRGSGRLKVAVFTDPDCPYCKRLEREFGNMTDITIHNFMMPIPSLHPAARAKAERIWCSTDRVAAWTGWMRQGTVPPQTAACPNPVADSMDLGERLGFNGTPTIVFPNGKFISGYLPNPELQEAIEANQQ